MIKYFTILQVYIKNGSNFAAGFKNYIALNCIVPIW
jgi:hypothetical protein